MAKFPNQKMQNGQVGQKIGIIFLLSTKCLPQVQGKILS